MKKCQLLKLAIIAAAFGLGLSANAEETNLEKAETKKNESIDSMKRNYRDGKDRICEMVNGKMKCVESKMGDKVRNLSDTAKTKEKDVKNKAE